MAASLVIFESTISTLTAGVVVGLVKQLVRHHKDHEETRERFKETQERLDDVMRAVETIARQQGVRLPSKGCKGKRRRT